MNLLTHRLVLFALCIAFSGNLLEALAQQSVTSASVSGTVHDASNAKIDAVSVIITNLDINQTWKTTSDEQGRFRFLYLPVGAYRLTVEQKGFAVFARQFTAFVGQAIDLPVELTITGVAENVSVSSEAPVVEIARTQVAETITPKDIDSLPLNGRNYLDLALLTPAVSRTNTGNNERFAETSAVPGTGISIAGQRNLNNGFLVDGLSANDDAADLAGTYFSQEVIREFQVVTSGGMAEFGRASSGTINMITHSGTNNWRGRAYGFIRNQRLDARNAFASTRDPLTQAQYGASIGGPLKTNRTFLFTNFEQSQLNRTGFITISPANVTAINEVLNRINYKGPLVTTGAFPTGYDTANFFARVDHNFSNSNRLATRYSFYNISSINARTVGGLNTTSRGTGLDDRDQTIALNHVITLTPQIINEARFQFTRSRLSAPANDSFGPAINISGVANLGIATSSPVKRDIDLFEILDNVSMQKGAHSLKIGGGFLLNRLNIVFPGAFEGAYTFASLDALKTGRYITFQQAFGETSQFQSNPNIGVYIQDEWRVRNGLTINAGLRYDLQFLPDPIETDTNNISPRIGIAYAPGSHKTVIRASYGLYYDRIPLRATSNALQRDGSKYKVASLSFGQAGAPIFPNVTSAFPSGVLISITTIDPQIDSSYAQQANLQIERQLSPSASLSVGYLHVRGQRIIMSRNVNVPKYSAAEATRLGIPNLGRPDLNFGNVSRFVSAGDSYYNGMTVSFNQRASRWTRLRLSYTYSKAIDTAGNNFFSSPQNNFDIRDERGLSNNDQRHRLTLSGSFDSPQTNGDSVMQKVVEGWQLSYIYSYGAALPYNIQTGADRNFDTSVNDRPIGVGRNTGKGFNSAALDLRLGRKFHFTERFGLETLIEGFNVLNRTNLQFPNNIIGTGATPLPSFGRATAAADPRQLQLGLRLSF